MCKAYMKEIDKLKNGIKTEIIERYSMDMGVKI